MRETVLGTVRDFIDFHIYLPTFLRQLRCFVERIIRKRLPDLFTHNSAIVRLSANSSCVSRHGHGLKSVPYQNGGCLFSRYPLGLVST